MQHFFGSPNILNYSSEIANISQSDLNQKLTDANISFEGRALPVMISPYIYSQTSIKTSQKLFEEFYKILQKAANLYTQNKEVQKYFSLESWHFDLITSTNPLNQFNQLCRFDFLYNEEGIPQIYENNTACPGGLLLSPDIAKLASKSALFQKIFSDHKLGWFPHQQHDLFPAVVSEAYCEKFKKLPTVAILNSRHNTLTNELDLMAKSLKKIGISHEVCFVEDLVVDGGEVFTPASKLKVDVCFQKFDNALSNEGISHFGANRDSVAHYVKAINQGMTIAINHFCSHYLTEQKSILAFLHDQKFESLFTSEERELIKLIVPYSVKVADASRDVLVDNKDNWVMKKSLDTRGRNVFIGSECSVEEWKKNIQVADQSKENFILQKRVPSEVANDIDKLLYVSHAAFLVRGKFSGMFPRFSTEVLTNVGRSGYLGIPLIAEDR